MPQPDTNIKKSKNLGKEDSLFFILLYYCSYFAQKFKTLSVTSLKRGEEKEDMKYQQNKVETERERGEKWLS